MSNKKRIISLIVLAVAFVIIAPVLIAFSLGYRISDIDDVFVLEKTGGIYIHSNISNTQVYLNGNFVKSNGVLLRNTLIQKLHPNTFYLVEVHKEGYQSWIKQLPVYSSLVTESRVLMLPSEIAAREILPFVTSDGTGTTTPTTTRPVGAGAKIIPNNAEYRELLTLFEGKDIYATTTAKTSPDSPKTAATTTAVATATVATATPQLPQYFVDLNIKDPDKLENLIENNNEVSWLENSNIILNWIGKENELPYYYCLELQNCSTQIILDWGDDIKKFDFLPGRNDIFVVLVDGGLYAVEVDNRSDRNIQYLYTEKIDDFIIGPGNKIFVRVADSIFELTI